jgi:uncharacterized membrane protein
MARLSQSDLYKISNTLRDDSLKAPSADVMKSTARNSYMIIALNCLWLLIPLFGILIGNDLLKIFVALIVAGAVLFASNNYLAKKWYYLHEYAEGSKLASHYANINDIGYYTYFATMIGSLAFLIVVVFVGNIFKTHGGMIVLGVDFLFAGFLVLLTVWIMKRVLKGLAMLAKDEAYA